jgi:protein O-GlcNAc transferase
MDLQSLMQEAGNHARNRRYPEAVACLEAATRLAPDFPPAWLSLGMMRTTVGDIDGSETALRRTLELDDENIDALLCLGVLLAGNQHTGEADQVFHRALELAPERVDISHAYSRVLSDTARTEEALAIIRAAQQHAPRDVSLQDKVCCLLNYLPDVPPKTVLEEHLAYGRLVGNPPPAHRISDRSPDRRLRVGYLSADLREHSVAYFLEPVLEHHDRTAFEVICLHIGAGDDKATPRLKGRVDHWRQLFPSTDDVLSRAIIDERIDILVELAGHAMGNRLPVVARHVAPVSVTYIGYPNTTGVPAIGYRLVDAHTDPARSDQWATEKLIRLDGCFLCYRPYEQSPDPAPRDSSSPITFGSFNNLAKLSNQTIDLYGRVLAAVPGSRLLLKGKGLGDTSVRSRVLSRLAAFNIAPERVGVLGHTKTTPEHLSLYHRMDIALDPFPYHGTTTTCEAMWMGVPVISLAGPAHASRVGISLMETVGLPEFIAQSPEDYVRTAAALASDATRLAKLRSGLRDQMKHSPLCDAPAYTRKLENAYREMWRSWCGPEVSKPGPHSPVAPSAHPSPAAPPATPPKAGFLGRIFGNRKP